MFKVFIKDCNKLNEKVKVELVGLEYDVGEDLLTTQNGKIECSEIVGDVSENDIAFVVSNYGEILYIGKIKTIEDNIIKTTQITEIFNDTWLYDIVDINDLEGAFGVSMQDYVNGEIKGSTYIDTLREKQLSPLKVNVKTHTEGTYEEQKEQYQVAMTKFIYTLFEKYNIIVRPNIPFTDWSIGSNDATIDIYKPDYDELLISDNVSSIQNLSITTTIEKVNKLVIFSKGSEETPSEYRTTFVYTENGIQEEPETDNGRLKGINTKIVFSDDEYETLIESNLPSEMFNHKITFDLLVDNKIYKWKDFKLGMPIKLYSNGHYYNSILTAYNIKQEDGENDLIYASITLGKIRTSLTKRLKTNYGIGGN